VDPISSSVLQLPHNHILENQKQILTQWNVDVKEVYEQSTNSLLRSMITKCSQNSSGMKTCCHIRGLIWQIEVGNFCNIIIKNKNIAGLNVTMNDVRISLFMQVFKPFCSTNSNFYTLRPCKDRTRLCSFNTFPP